MPNENDETIPLDVEYIFKNTDYIVPIYQRNYAWGESEITQLIDDVYDYSIINEDRNYYIGTLVVYKRVDGKLEVIDGQQRLTTLFILLNVLKHEFNYEIDTENINLYFESRIKSTLALKKVTAGNIKNISEKIEYKIFDAYEEIKKRLKKQDIDVQKFKKYLLDKVVILRTAVPPDTDLNHYFEIMNNRGEQLEKHEILKSRMLDKLSKNDSDMVRFNLIWESCSNMEKYIQYGFPVDLRNNIFGINWNKFELSSFDDNKLESQGQENSNNEYFSISALIAGDKKIQNPYEDKKTVDNDTPERFTSVISFQNFLLHVLKIQENKDIPLDDKRLLETFSDYYKDAAAVKKFAFNLLRLRFLFDQYITKREYTSNGDRWSLKQLVKNENSKNNTAYYKNTFENEDKNSENKNLLMLLTMFHVSYPTQIYKHWLSGVLKYLFEFKDIDTGYYEAYLKELAKKYIADRYLCKEPSGFHQIIFGNSEACNNPQWENLNQGTNVENFIFNYLDYLLWEKQSLGYDQFEFSFRTSVEHYYPQHPMEGIDTLDGSILNSFGNLCLISSSENSRLSNLTPKAKKDFYLKQKNQSLIQKMMMDYEEWNKDSIKVHQMKMVAILEGSLALEDKSYYEAK